MDDHVLFALGLARFLHSPLEAGVDKACHRPRAHLLKVVHPVVPFEDVCHLARRKQWDPQIGNHFRVRELH